ncbi:MAG: BON domain-containing protein [Candidatus Rokubacteria bacterium]|nr:BON domain-containing protein [Candidatus Rokubacteria bacterium]
MMPEHEQDEGRDGYVIGPASNGPDVELTGARGVPSPHSDAQIASDVQTRYAASSLASCRLDVRVADRVVTVSGTVPDEAAKHLAEHVAESVAGVRSIRSEVTVRRGGRVA